MFRTLAALTVLCACTPSATQPATPPLPGPEPSPMDWQTQVDRVFPEDTVVQVTLDLADGEWESMLTEWDQQRTKLYHPASLQYGDETLDSVGVRLKGFSSLIVGSGFGGGQMQLPPDPRGKFPLKIDFNRFGGPRLHGLDKVGLSNNWSDLSLMREHLATRIYRGMGVPAAQTSYAEVSINGTNHGLYTLVQPIDKRFLEQHYGAENGDGNLYKAVFTSSDAGALVWAGDAPQAYISTACQDAFDTCGLLLKTNQEDPERNDYADLITLLDTLNNAPDSTFEAELEAVFDIDGFLRLTAVTNALASFDSYLGMGHNYYLYHRPDDGRFIMLPWDLNESFAGHPCPSGGAIDFAVQRTICEQRGHDFVLARRVFEVARWRDTYEGYLREIAEDWLTPERVGPWIDQLDALIGHRVPTDPNYIATEVDYRRSLGTDPPDGVNRGGHGGPEYNLLDFVNRRQAALLDQLDAL